tara:strand:- start:41 stop:973 length:933 start_codon:yes stop_codon:yes gene_type:complete
MKDFFKYEQMQITLLKSIKNRLGVKFIHAFTGAISKLIGKQYDIILRVTNATSSFISLINKRTRKYNKTALPNLTIPRLKLNNIITASLKKNLSAARTIVFLGSNKKKSNYFGGIESCLEVLAQLDITNDLINLELKKGNTEAANKIFCNFFLWYFSKLSNAHKFFLYLRRQQSLLSYIEKTFYVQLPFFFNTSLFPFNSQEKYFMPLLAFAKDINKSMDYNSLLEKGIISRNFGSYASINKSRQSSINIGGISIRFLLIKNRPCFSVEFLSIDDVKNHHIEIISTNTLELENLCGKNIKNNILKLINKK